jgi:hypothetical protein
MKAKGTFRIVLLSAALLGAITLAVPAIWKPWVSPRYAAEMLTLDDGKGLVFWAPRAAKFWGHEIYSPLSDATGHFNDLNNWVGLITLFEIVGSDTPENVSEIYRELLGSSSAKVRMVGFYAAKKHSLPAPNLTEREAEIRNALTRRAEESAPNVSDLEMHLALMVIAATPFEGVQDSLRNILNGEEPSYWTAVHACRALEGIPEREMAENILASAVTKPVFYPRVECAESLVKVMGKRSDLIIEKAIQIEADESKRKRLRNLI